MDSLGQAAPIVVEVVVVSLVVIICAAWVVQAIVAPEWWSRFTVRYYMFFRTPAERERICNKSDRMAYYHLGTTGDSNKDAKIRRFDGAYGRGLGIAIVIAFLGMILFAVMHALLS